MRSDSARRGQVLWSQYTKRRRMVEGSMPGPSPSRNRKFVLLLLVSVEHFGTLIVDHNGRMRWVA